MRPKSDNYSELERYISCRNDVREQLVENPDNNPVAIVSFLTDIREDDYKSICSLMSRIEHDVKLIDADATVSFELTHHSPFDLIMPIIASIPTVLPICQLIYYTIATHKNTIDLSNTTSHRKKGNKSNIDGIEVYYTKKYKCITLGKFEIKLTTESEKHYGRIKEVAYTITGIAPEVAGGHVFLSSTSHQNEE